MLTQQLTPVLIVICPKVLCLMGAGACISAQLSCLRVIRVGGSEEVRPMPLDLTPALVAAAEHLTQLTQLWLRGTKLCDSSMVAVGQLRGLQVRETETVHCISFLDIEGTDGGRVKAFRASMPMMLIRQAMVFLLWSYGGENSCQNHVILGPPVPMLHLLQIGIGAYASSTSCPLESMVDLCWMVNRHVLD